MRTPTLVGWDKSVLTMREVIGHNDFHFLDGFLCSKEAVTLSLKSRWSLVFWYERRDLTYSLKIPVQKFTWGSILILLCFWVRVGKADPADALGMPWSWSHMWMWSWMPLGRKSSSFMGNRNQALTMDRYCFTSSRNDSDTFFSMKLGPTGRAAWLIPMIFLLAVQQDQRVTCDMSVGDSRFTFCLIGETSVYMLYLYFFLFNLELDRIEDSTFFTYQNFRDNQTAPYPGIRKMTLWQFWWFSISKSLLRGHARPKLSLWYHGGSCQCCKPFGVGGPHRARETAEALCEYGEGWGGEV